MKILSVDLATGEYTRKDLINKKHPNRAPSKARMVNWIRKLGPSAVWAAYPQNYDDRVCLRDFNKYIRGFAAQRGVVPPTWNVPYE